MASGLEMANTTSNVRYEVA